MEPNMRQSAEPQKIPAVQDGGVDVDRFFRFAEFCFHRCFSLAAPPVPAELDAIMAIAPFSKEQLILLYVSGAPPVPAELDAIMAIAPFTKEELILLYLPGAPPVPAVLAASMTIRPFSEEELSLPYPSAAPPLPAEPDDVVAAGPSEEEGLSRRSAARPVGPGFRFHPTDEELVGYYLKRQVTGKSKLPIYVVDIYKFEPWDLPSKSKLNTRGFEWYFFTVLDKKYGRGSKTKRATEKGYWKPTGKDQNIKHAERAFGKKKILVYYEGRAPHGRKSNWVMHEYSIVDDQAVAQARPQQKEQPLVVCRIFKKSGKGPKNGEHYGAPFTNLVCDSTTLGPALRFHPTDEELVGYFLKCQVAGKSLNLPIAVVDIYKFEPQDLPGKSKLNTRDLEWYFFTVLDKKYGSRSRTHRATEEGYWKTTGKDRAIKDAERAFGMKKTLVYHKGRAPHGTRSNWVMYEYRIVDDQDVAQARPQQEQPLVVRRIFGKSGPGPKNGEQSSAPLIEEEGDDDGEPVRVPFVANESLVEVSAGEAGAFVETDNLGQLHSASESSNAAHVTACMVSITNITVRGNAMDWMMGKNGGFNTIISSGFSHPVVASAMLPVSGLLTSKTAVT